MDTFIFVAVIVLICIEFARFGRWFVQWYSILRRKAFLDEIQKEMAADSGLFNLEVDGLEFEVLGAQSKEWLNFNIANIKPGMIFRSTDEPFNIFESTSVLQNGKVGVIKRDGVAVNEI